MIIKWPWTRTQIEAVRPDMTRRRFLQALAAVPVAAAIAPELLDLLKPPKVYSFPGGRYGPDWISGDFTTGNLRYKTTERFSAGMADWRGVFGSSPRSGIMRSADFRKQMATSLNEAFSNAYDESHAAIWQQLYGDASKVQLDAEVYGLGLARVKQEGGVIAYDHIPHAEAMKYQHQAYALGFQITEEAPDEDLTDWDAVRADLAQRRRTRICGVGSDHGYNQLEAATQQIQRGADGLVASIDRAVDTVNALPAAAEDLARDIAASPVDLVKRIFRV